MIKLLMRSTKLAMIKLQEENLTYIHKANKLQEENLAILAMTNRLRKEVKRLRFSNRRLSEPSAKATASSPSASVGPAIRSYPPEELLEPATSKRLF